MKKETKKYDEDYLNGLIAKAKKSWEGVDVESFMSDLRDDTDKEDSEKEQKAVDKANYKQGYNDAIKTACNVFCYTGCPHKIDSYNCLNDKCDTWKIFRRMMEEQL